MSTLPGATGCSAEATLPVLAMQWKLGSKLDLLFPTRHTWFLAGLLSISNEGQQHRVIEENRDGGGPSSEPQ